MKIPGWICGSCAVLTLVAPASAHHSFAMFDRSTEIELEGEVKEFQWTNPHTWTQLLVEGEDGAVVEWSIEGGSPNGLTRQGWKRNSLQPGERITMTVNPLMNGRPGGSIVRAVKADGSVLGRALPPPDQDFGD
jgi:hypothetical protein